VLGYTHRTTACRTSYLPLYPVRTTYRPALLHTYVATLHYRCGRAVDVYVALYEQNMCVSILEVEAMPYHHPGPDGVVVMNLPPTRLLAHRLPCLPLPCLLPYLPVPPFPYRYPATLLYCGTCLPADFSACSHGLLFLFLSSS